MMLKKCNVYGCHGDYRSEPYIKAAPFPIAMPNDRFSLLKLREIYACVHHFDWDWVKVKGGKKLSKPPSFFLVVAPCLKQYILF